MWLSWVALLSFSLALSFLIPVLPLFGVSRWGHFIIEDAMRRCTAAPYFGRVQLGMALVPKGVHGAVGLADLCSCRQSDISSVACFGGFVFVASQVLVVGFSSSSIENH